MDDLLIPVYRQYLQQVPPSHIRYPPSKLLMTSDIQDQLYRYFFNEEHDRHLPPPEYQRKVLKRILNDIEKELEKGTYDEDEYAISDDLMLHMGVLSTVPQQSDIETAQKIRTLSYFFPTNTSAHADENATVSRQQHRILIRESPNLLAAGSNVGLRTWEACLHLAYYLTTAPDLAGHHPARKPIHDANVIELGAGTGLLSLICSPFSGARHTLSTDGLPHVVEGIQSNITYNLNQHRSHDSTKFPVPVILDWTNPDNLDEILCDTTGQIPEYDYILGADITYHPDLANPLASLLKRLKTMFPHVRILISATVRNEHTLNNFRTICEHKYELKVRDIPDTEWKCPDFRDQTGFFHEQAFPIVIMDIGG